MLNDAVCEDKSCYVQEFQIEVQLLLMSWCGVDAFKCVGPLWADL